MQQSELASQAFMHSVAVVAAARATSWPVVTAVFVCSVQNRVGGPGGLGGEGGEGGEGGGVGPGPAHAFPHVTDVMPGRLPLATSNPAYFR